MLPSTPTAKKKTDSEAASTSRVSRKKEIPVGNRSCWFSLPLLFPTGVSLFRLARLVLAASESVFFFAVGVLGSNLHHPTQGHVTGSTKFQAEFSVLDTIFEGAYCLMVRDIFHSVVQSDPPLNILSESLIGFLHAACNSVNPAGRLQVPSNVLTNTRDRSSQV